MQAQNPFIQHFTTTDGLPSNAINTIVEDNEKFLWFSTEGGLVRYDGSTFTRYTSRDGLYRDHVVQVKPDSHGRVWFFCIGARPNYFYQNKIYNGNNAPFLDSLRFSWTFVEDRQGNLYFYNYHDRRIKVLDTGNHVTHFTIDIEQPESSYWDSTHYNIHHLVRLPSDEYMIWTFEGIYKTADMSEKPVKIASFEEEHNIYLVSDTIIYDAVPDPATHSTNLVRYCNGMPGDTILFPGAAMDVNSWMMEDDRGNVWVTSTEKGIFCLHNKQVIYHIDLKENAWISKDHEGNIWVTSKDGAYRISPYVVFAKHFDRSCFGGGGIDDLDADPSGRIWGLGGSNIYQYRDNQIFSMDVKYQNIVFTDFLALSDNALLLWDDIRNTIAFTGISIANQDKKLIYGKAFPLDLLPGSGIPAANRNKDIVCEWDHNEVVTCSVKNGFREIDRVKIGRSAKVIFDARDKLVVLEPHNPYFIRGKEKIPYDEFSGFNKPSLKHIPLDTIADAFLTHSDSLILVKNKQVFNLTSSFDYSFHTPVKNLAFQSPVLYVSTFRNIYACEPLEMDENKPVALRLIDINFADIRDIEAVRDSLFIASSDGLTIIPIHLIDSIQTRVPVPYFREIKVNDSTFDPYSRKVVVKGQNKITFEFGNINYSDNPVIYSYMLEGFDQDWNTGTVQNVAYGSVPRGHYTFRLRAGKNNAPWSEPISYEIQVNATVWQHPLFYAALAVLLAGLAFLLLAYRNNVRMKKREIEHQLVTLEQKALQSMMNPHFLFNALGSIQNYLLQNKPGEAGLYLSQFARLIRQNISSIHSAMISLEAEVDRLKNYLDLEKLRMANRFDYKIEIDKNIEDDDVLIPSMITQPFVENCILHGISPIGSNGMIIIAFKMVSDKAIRIIIEDNGVGIKQSKAFKTNDRGHLHMSMEMTRKRIEILGKKYKVETTLEITDASPGSPNPGTRVTVVLPVSWEGEP